MNKVLVIRFSSIGDIVLTTPVVRALKQQLNAEVHYLTKESFASIPASNPYVDRVHVLSKNLGTVLKELKQENFDFIIDLHANFRTFLVKSYLLKPSASFRKLNFEKFLLVHFHINRLPQKHIVQRYLEAGRKLGILDDGKGLNFFIPEKDEISPDKLPAAFQTGYTAVVIGATYFTKRLPDHKVIKLCERIKGPVVLIGGKSEIASGERIEQHFRSTDPEKILNTCGQYNLNQSASLVKNASKVFSNDTGLMHIAAAFQKETFSIWGNTVPDFGMYPYQTPHTIIEVKNLPCRPCSKLGFEKCPKGHFHCMEKIEFKEEY